MSPISSRKRVPPFARSKRPLRRATAPVKAPRSCPKSSDSRRCSGMAAQFTATKGPSARPLAQWMACAMSSFPVPDSPVTSTVAGEEATRANTWKISAISGPVPTITGPVPLSSVAGGSGTTFPFSSTAIRRERMSGACRGSWSSATAPACSARMARFREAPAAESRSAPAFGSAPTRWATFSSTGSTESERKVADQGWDASLSKSSVRPAVQVKSSPAAVAAS